MVGPNGRLSDFRDRESRVYVEAIVQEVQRWQPIVPVGILITFVWTTSIEGMEFPKTQRSWLSLGEETLSAIIRRAILHDGGVCPDP